MNEQIKVHAFSIGKVQFIHTITLKKTPKFAIQKISEERVFKSPQKLLSGPEEVEGVEGV